MKRTHNTTQHYIKRKTHQPDEASPCHALYPYYSYPYTLARPLQQRRLVRLWSFPFIHFERLSPLLVYLQLPVRRLAVHLNPLIHLQDSLYFSWGRFVHRFILLSVYESFFLLSSSPIFLIPCVLFCSSTDGVLESSVFFSLCLCLCLYCFNCYISRSASWTCASFCCFGYAVVVAV